MTRLLLVRHGESQVTVRRVVGGMATCTGLTPLGQRQSEALRDRWLAHPEVTADVVISSDMPRALETATIVVAALGDLEIGLDPGLREMDPGPEFDGLSWDEVVQRVETTSWETDPYVLGFPGGETVAGFQYRAAAALANLVNTHKGATVIAFCHAGVIDVALRLFLRTPLTGGFELRTLNTSITDVEQQPSGLWRLRRYNDAAHLAGLPASTQSDA